MIMFYDFTSFVFHTAEDLRLHCVSSYWPTFYSLWVRLSDLGYQRTLVAPFNFLMAQNIILQIALFSVVVLVTSIFSLKMFIFYHKRKTRFHPSLHQKTILITEACSDVGLETAKDMARRGAHLIITSSNILKGAMAREEIINNTGNDNVVMKYLDFSSMESVKQFAKDIMEYEHRLDIIVLQSDIQLSKRYMTEEGFELHLAVNYLGPFLLSNLLLPIMHKTITLKRLDCDGQNEKHKIENESGTSEDSIKTSAPQISPTRVIVVSNGLPIKRIIDVDNLNSNKYFEATSAYESSKLAIVLFAKEFAKRLQTSQNLSCFTYYDQARYQTSSSSQDIIVNIVSPWWFWDYRNVSSPLLRIFRGCFERILFTDPTDLSKPIIYVATSDETKTTTGGYFSRYNLVKESKIIEDKIIGSKLWEKSSELVELDQNISLEYIL